MFVCERLDERNMDGQMLGWIDGWIERMKIVFHQQIILLVSVVLELSDSISFLIFVDVLVVTFVVWPSKISINIQICVQFFLNVVPFYFSSFRKQESNC